MEMMACPECGEDICEDELFCPFCDEEIYKMRHVISALDNVNGLNYDDVQTIREIESAFIIVGGFNRSVYGELDRSALFVWSTREKAEEFSKTVLIPNYEILNEPIRTIARKARGLGFKKIRFDFRETKNPEQTFPEFKISEILS